MTNQEIDQIKNELLCYLLEAVEGNFQHLTEDERGIVGNQETFDVLRQSINTPGGARCSSKIVEAQNIHINNR